MAGAFAPALGAARSIASESGQSRGQSDAEKSVSAHPGSPGLHHPKPQQKWTGHRQSLLGFVSRHRVTFAPYGIGRLSAQPGRIPSQASLPKQGIQESNDILFQQDSSRA